MGGAAGAKKTGVPTQVLWMYLVVFLDITGIALVVPLIPSLAKQMGMSNTAYGLVTSFYGLAQILSCPLMGALSDVRGRKIVFLVSLVGAAIAYALFGISARISSVVLLCMSRILVGIVKQTMTISTAFVTDYSTAEERTPALAYLYAITNIAFMLGAASGGILSSVLGSVIIPAFGSAVLYVIAFILCFCCIDDTGGSLGKKQVCPALAMMGKKPEQFKNKDAPHPIPEFKGSVIGTITTEFKGLLKDMANNRRVRHAALASFLSTFATIITQSSQAMVTQTQFGLSVKHNGYLISYSSLVSAFVSYLIIPRLEIWLKRRQLPGTAILAAAALTAGLGLLLQASTRSVRTLMVWMLFSEAGRSLFLVYLNAMFTCLYEAEIGAAQGIFSNIESVCRVLGPALSGILLDLGGSGMPWTVAGALNICLAIYAYLTFQVKEATSKATPKKDL